jgi:hypothetical protein
VTALARTRRKETARTARQVQLLAVQGCAAPMQVMARALFAEKCDDILLLAQFYASQTTSFLLPCPCLHL